MNRLELSQTLEKRIGWKQPSASSIVIDDDNLVSESGRYFQNEHSFVKVSLIKDIIEKANANDAELNIELSDLRKQVVLLVVDEAFSGQNVNNLDLETSIETLDAAISKRMAMKIGELLTATTRSNRVERISKEALQMFFFDINGDPNFPNKLSIAESYAKELDYLKDMFNTEKMLDVNTLGNNRNFLTSENLRFY
mgnify:FL=1